MKMQNLLKTSAVLPAVLSLIVLGLVGVSGYLLYSNAALKSSISQQGEAETQQEQNDLATTTIEKEVEVHSTQEIISSQKQTVATGGASAWASFYDELVDLEDEFHLHFDFIDWEATVNEASIDLQIKAVDGAVVAAKKIRSKVAQGKNLFPSQLTCLHKEGEAFEKFESALPAGRDFFQFVKYDNTSNGVEAKLLSEVNAMDLHARQEEYGKAIEALDEALVLLDEAKSNAQKAGNAIPLPGLKDYIAWADAYSAGLREVRVALEEEDEDFEAETDFVSIGKMHDEAILDLGTQIADWSVTNLTSVLTAAGQAYAQSNSLCTKE